jgi:ElaB/YqjD/DUF883 family membrane-anchored ribosome-binding protein
MAGAPDETPNYGFGWNWRDDLEKRLVSRFYRTDVGDGTSHVEALRDALEELNWETAEALKAKRQIDSEWDELVPSQQEDLLPDLKNVQRVVRRCVAELENKIATDRPQTGAGVAKSIGLMAKKLKAATEQLRRKGDPLRHWRYYHHKQAQKAKNRAAGIPDVYLNQWD